MNNKLSTDSYKGVRDFYPEEMQVQQYIFSHWSKTAESFGFERYDASILEPAELYKSKGAANEEIVNEQTYTFIDRGEREVTLRPEMTPTVARLVARRRRELPLPIRWYSIPNLFRYERPQRGRLREHWQLNCDMFGVDDYSADLEIITLARQVLLDFGATDDMFTIRVNNRAEMETLYQEIGISDEGTVNAITRLNDRKAKIRHDEYLTSLQEILKNEEQVAKVITLIEDTKADNLLTQGLKSLRVNNVVLDRSIARGFDYYTGMIFEIIDNDPNNNRSMMGGGRYDNLTSMFDGEPISGVGFGMGDVTMRDFLVSHKLLQAENLVGAPTLIILPISTNENLPALSLAQEFRSRGLSVATDTTNRKLGKKISTASERGTTFAIVLGDEEVKSQVYTLRNLKQEVSVTGSLPDLLTSLYS